jgi:transcriptional regulator with XRE-family HTH domain
MSNGLRQTFAKEVRAARYRCGLSQAEVAERIGIAVEAYGRLERGAVLPRAETLVGLAYAFNVSADRLLGIVVEEAPAQPVTALDTAAADPDWRRIVTVLEQLSPRSLRLLANAVRSIRDDSDEQVKPAPTRR